MTLRPHPSPPQPVLRVLSSFLLVNTALWVAAMRWRRRHRQDRVWTRAMVAWGAWILLGWISIAAHTAIMLRFPR